MWQYIYENIYIVFYAAEDEWAEINEGIQIEEWMVFTE